MATTEPVASPITTAEQLLNSPGLGRCELVRGELTMMTPAGSEHGYLTARLTAHLVTFVYQHSLGKVFGAETGFRIAREPDTVRAPDIAFVGRERLAEPLPKGYFQGAPDLAVEVVSPGDRASQVLAKVQDWLDAGCQAVWVVDPETRTVTVYRSRSRIVVLGASDQLSGEDVVPGFALSVAELFA
jgi:Uma2 family endonuclease